ncbi:MAG TPA: hypothetical protein VH496_14255 [Mycobacterium sp.]|jgi:hypothetical protein
MSDGATPPRIVGADADIAMVLAEVDALRELAQDPQKAHDADRVYSFSIRWGALLFGRLERLANYSGEGALSVQEQQRYDALRAGLRELLPVMDRLGLARPGVPLSG